ncbi:MAG: ABC transporter ATP-binding protein [Candidatus Schekmanbacteria bacterium]|nr:ABC transporter ATP-binding protein [Candidatus Schekmanbacteria bacterium]
MILHLHRVTKAFGGLVAVRDVTFAVAPGQIAGLIGPNGAGKTTLFNCINGVVPITAGRVELDGRAISGLPPHAVARLGLARTHQIVRPLKELTVRENTIAGACFGRERHGLKAAARLADEALERLELSSLAAVPAGNLTIAMKKRLELARALAAQPRLLLLDEVLAGLNATEVGQMVRTIRSIRESGVTIVMIEHIMHAVMALSDRVLVIDRGTLIADGEPKAVARDPAVIAAYLGKPSEPADADQDGVSPEAPR